MNYEDRPKASYLPGLPDADPDAPPIPGMQFLPVEQRKQRQPGGLFLLFIVEMWERFSYYGMRALLVLYLVTIVALPDIKPGIHETGIIVRNKTSKVEQTRQAYLVVNQPADAVKATQWPPVDALHIDAPSGEIIRASNGKFVNQSFDYILKNTSANDIEYDFEFDWQQDEAGAGGVAGTGGGGGAPKPVVRPMVGRWLPDAEDPSRGTISTSALSGTLKPGDSTTVTIRASEFNSGRGLPRISATTIYGWYTGLVYLSALIGGLIADKLIGTHRSMLTGGVLIALGHITLALSGLKELVESDLGMTVFIGGLALIVLGTGHFKPCVSVMVGQLYKPGDVRRDGGFSIYYMGINLGAFLCAFVCGTLGETVGWHWGFGSAAVGMIMGLICYLIGRPAFLKGIGLPPPGVRNYAPVMFMISLLLAAGFAYFWQAGGPAEIMRVYNDLVPDPKSKQVMLALFAVTAAGVILWFIAIQAKGDKGPVAGIIALVLFNAIFWIGFEQAGSSLNLFARDMTDRTLAGREIPATWFQSINPFVILLAAPIFAVIWTRLGRKNRNPSQAVKFGIGLILLGLGYLFMVYAGVEAKDGAKVGMIWLTATYFFHTLGELCVSPTGLSFVTKAAPARFVSFLMGIWFLGNFIANLGGGLLAGYVEKIEKGEINLPWYQWHRFGGQADFYMMFVVASVGAGLLVLILSPLLNRMMHGRG